MAKQTKIEWTARFMPDSTVYPGGTFNPWIGCTKISEGCKGCYAEELMDHRYKKVQWGPQGQRIRTSTANWGIPMSLNNLSSKDGIRRRIFCASLADIGDDHPSISQAWRLDLMELVMKCKNVDWLFLTKRPQNIPTLYPEWMDAWPEHVWMGATTENQKCAHERIPLLLQIPAKIRFLSVEPMLSPIDLTGLWFPKTCWHCKEELFGEPGRCWCGQWYGTGIHWVICGGESGTHARPMHPQWATNLRDQCVRASVPFFFKQWGEWIAKPQIADLIDGKWCVHPEWKEIVKKTSHWGVLTDEGEYFSETTTWNGRQNDPRDNHEVIVYKVGKHEAGRVLDGRLWNESPEI